MYLRSINVDKNKIDIEAEKVFFSILITGRIGTIRKCFSKETINNVNDPVRRLLDSTYKTYQTTLDKFKSDVRSRRQSSIGTLRDKRNANLNAIQSQASLVNSSAPSPNTLPPSSRPAGGIYIGNE